MNRDQMRKRIKAITGGFRGPAEPVAQDKATKLALTIKGKMGGVNSVQEMAMVALLSETAGVDVLSAYNRLPNSSSVSSLNKYLQPLVSVVCLVGHSCHNGPLNVPLVMLDNYASTEMNSRAVTHIGGITNNIHSNSSGQMRLATDEEIDRLTDAQLDYFIKLYTL